MNKRHEISMETRQFNFNTHKHSHTHTYARKQTNTLARIQLNDFNPAKSHFPANIFFCFSCSCCYCQRIKSLQKHFINNFCQNERKRNRNSRKKRVRAREIEKSFNNAFLYFNRVLNT